MTDSAEIYSLMKPCDLNSLPRSVDAPRAQLDRILRSKTFQRARRLRGLLEYVVNAATNGQVPGQLQTARDLFGKSEDFDPSLDPVIRVQFGRLRRALASYYSTEGAKDTLIIDIPNRQYAPVFQNAGSNQTTDDRRQFHQ